MNNGFEMNKIAASVLIAGIIAMIANFITEAVYEEKAMPEKRGYKIEGVVEATTTTAGTEEFKWPEFEIGKLMATADLNAGKIIFNKCAVCHSPEKGGAAKVGPNLWNIVGAKKAAHTDYTYSTAMTEHGGDWDYDDLFKMLYSPKNYTKGTKMAFVGLKKPEEIANIVAYLRSLSDSPAPLPAADAKSK